MDTLKIVRSFYKTKLSNGKSLLELSSYNNISMWWAADAIFYDFIDKSLRDEDASRRFNRSIFLKYISKHRNVFVRIYKFFGIYAARVYDNAIHLVIRFIECRFGKDNKIIDSKPTVLITAQDPDWKSVCDYETGESRQSDVYSDSIIRKLSELGFNLMGIYPIDLYPLCGLNVYIQKLKFWYICHVPLNKYYNKKSWNCEKNATSYFKGVWNVLENDRILKELCDYNGVEYEIVKDELAIYFLILFPHNVKYIQIARNMIKNLKPNLILILNEHYWWERTLISAAKLEGIPTLAIQHGVIHPLCKNYNYTEDELASDGRGTSPYCPIADKTAVYGRYHRDILTKISSYPTNSVVVTGQPRYDVISYIDDIYSKDAFIAKYGIDSNTKILLWTTQCHGLSNNECFKNFRCMSNVMKKLDNCTLIIKQHPGEAEMYTNWINEQVVNLNDNNVILTSKNSDTLEQIHACDLMITKNSTTAMEAVALDKPVIILNLSGESDLVNYVDEGVALGVYEETNLKQTIETLLMDDSVLSKNRDKYIGKYLYKLDGGATNRVVDVIISMLKGESI